MKLPSVPFCGLDVTRLVIGANPFGGYSHQSPERDKAMRAHCTVPHILETWKRAEAAGINTMVTNNTSQNVTEAVEAYLSGGGKLQWIAQINIRVKDDMKEEIDRCVAIGCKALYIHGFQLDDAFRRRDASQLADWCAHARAKGIPVGVAGHSPEAHLWADSLGIADFHAVCFFNCGSLHAGKGHKFRLADLAPAIDVIRRIKKPCIGYKILGAGRLDPRLAFEYAFESIKPGDVVNVGMYRGDKDGIVEENADLARTILG
jgi:hypothetical protein